MNPDSHLSGREERRLPIMMEVTLVPVGSRNVDRGERTFTDNISEHGIRVQSTSAWRMGEQAEVTPTKGEVSLRGEVVYCQKVDGRFFVGLKSLRGQIPWSVLKRFNGLALTGILAAMRW
jgi:PilZ domain-containing protein